MHMFLKTEKIWFSDSPTFLFCFDLKEYDKYKASVDTGISLAIEECQTQFRYEKWNCSVPSTISKVPVFIKAKLPYGELKLLMV